MGMPVEPPASVCLAIAGSVKEGAVYEPPSTWRTAGSGLEASRKPVPAGLESTCCSPWILRAFYPVVMIVIVSYYQIIRPPGDPVW